MKPYIRSKWILLHRTYENEHVWAEWIIELANDNDQEYYDRYFRSNIDSEWEKLYSTSRAKLSNLNKDWTDRLTYLTEEEYVLELI